ncbi:MAG: trehalase family glycosidase, partial [Bacillota bacterium]|nr:trehalase family glycosidase [Bacillota bacterium]
PIHYIAVHGLARYGFEDAARRIAKKYTDSMEKIFEQTGTLWEKYNVEDGSTNVTDEYKMPEMLGWTAGVYLDLKKFLGEI